MIDAIETLRTIADKCEHRARCSNDRAVQAELFDMTAKWHWLAAEAAKLFDRSEQLEKA